MLQFLTIGLEGLAMVATEVTGICHHNLEARLIVATEKQKGQKGTEAYAHVVRSSIELQDVIVAPLADRFSKLLLHACGRPVIALAGGQREVAPVLVYEAMILCK